MHLLLQRSQRDDGWFASSMMFTLDARLDLSAEEHALFEKYRPGSFVVYESNDHVAHSEAACENFDRAANTPILNATALTLVTAVWDNVAGLARGAMTALSLRITFADLLDGQHIESDDLDAILIAEDRIVGFCHALASHLETAITFDGREELLELHTWQERRHAS